MGNVARAKGIHKLNGAKKVRTVVSGMFAYSLLDDLRVMAQRFENGRGYGPYKCIGRAKSEDAGHNFLNRMVEGGAMELDLNVTRRRINTSPKGLDWQAIFNEAHARGLVAGTAHTPRPMIVVQRANPLDDTSPIIHQYEPVMDGVCGFAWITIKPANSQAARWAVKNGIARKNSWEPGVTIWVSEFGQSYERKMKYAEAYAETLRKYGINAYAHGRLD